MSHNVPLTASYPHGYDMMLVMLVNPGGHVHSRLPKSMIIYISRRGIGTTGWDIPSPSFLPHNAHKATGHFSQSGPVFPFSMSVDVDMPLLLALKVGPLTLWRLLLESLPTV